MNYVQQRLSIGEVLADISVCSNGACFGGADGNVWYAPVRRPKEDTRSSLI